jgi:DNA-binding beta-propeller fold protein YncE
VTELDANTGGLVRVISAAKYGFNTPYAMAVTGADLWAANFDQANGNSVTELDAKTGRLVRLISRLNYSPDAIAVAAGRVWVATENGGSRENGSVIELSEGTGGVLRVISASKYRFDWPGGIGVTGGHVWVANTYGNSVTELNATTGGLVRVISDSK